MAPHILFSRIDIFSLVERSKAEFKARLAITGDKDFEDLGKELLSSLQIKVPVLDEAKKYAKSQDVPVDVSRDPRRHISNRSRPFYVPGTEVNIFVPFNGDPHVFGIRPTAFDLNPPYGDVVGNELKFTYSVPSGAQIDINQENARTVSQVRKYLDWLRPSAEQLEAELLRLHESFVTQRKQDISNRGKLLSSLSMPIRNDEQIDRAPIKKTALKRIRPEIEGWDVFISHASEDKDAIARPLANALEGKGLRVWYDEFSLKVGDSLREKIDHGLSRSNFGVVILSPHFFEKHWPQKELNGLATREINSVKVVLPVWHEVGFDEVRAYSPTLADRVAVSTGKGLEHVVVQLLAAM